MEPIVFADTAPAASAPVADITLYEPSLVSAEGVRVSSGEEGSPVQLAASVPRLDRFFAEELASDEKTSGLPSYSRFLFGGDPHPSEILETKSKPGERMGELYDRMLRTNLDLSGYFDKRIDAVMKLPRRIVPADASPLAKEIAEFCHKALTVVPDFAINLRHQLMSIPKGNAFDELVVEKLSRGPLAGAWVPVNLIDRPMWRFTFVQGVLHVRQGPTKSVPAPYGKFLAMRYATKDTAWSTGLLDDCYWAWFLAKNGYKFWATFLDKYGMPLAVGHYPPAGRRPVGGEHAATSGADQRLLMQVLQRMRTEYAITLPEGLDVKLLEANRSGSVSYESFQGMLNRSMAVKILGEVDTSGAAKGPGSFSKSEISDGVRREKVVLDGRNFSGHMRDNLLTPIVRWNYGPDAPVPYWVIDTLDAEDREDRREGIRLVLEVGEDVPRRHLYQTAQVPEPEDGEAVVRKAPAAPVTPSATPPAPAPPADPEPAKAARPRAAGVVRLESIEGDIEELAAEAVERDAEFTEVAQTISERTIDYYGDWQRALLSAWDSGAVAEGRGLRVLVGAVNPPANARALETAQVHGMALAMRQVIAELGYSVVRAELPQGWDQYQNDPRNALDYWAGQLVIPKSSFLGLSDANRRLAFTVAGVTDLDLLNGIYLLIGEALSSGLSRSEFVARVELLFRARGVEPLAKWHAELVYANNVRQAANLMRFQQLILNPAAKNLTPYLMWLTLQRNTRPEHQVMHGYVAATDHEIWRMWWPPAGHNCGCYLASIAKARARRMGLTGSEPMGPWPTYEGTRSLPDEGFRGAPGTVFRRVSDEMERRALDTVESAARSGSDDFAEASQQLFGQLFGGSSRPENFAAFLAAGEERRVA